MYDCDAEHDEAIIEATTCTVKVQNLLASPFRLTYQAQVNATVTAVNKVGDSAVSSPGNGAIIPTLLGAPSNLLKDRNQTTTSQVSFNWTAPEDDGGQTILYYSVEKYNETSKNYTEVDLVPTN